MAIEGLRQNPLFGSLLPRKENVIAFPRFAATVPLAQPAPVSVSLQSDTFTPSDVFQPTADAQQARIILLPRNQKESFFTHALHQASEAVEQWSKGLIMTMQALPSLDPVREALAASAKTLANAISPDTKIDEQGNLYGEFKLAEAEYPPEPTAAETKAADAAAAQANTKALIAAFKQQLEKIPAGYTSVSVQLPEELPAGVDKDQVVREVAKLSVLNGYNYNQFREGVNSSDIASVSLSRGAVLPPSSWKVAQALSEGTILGSAMNLTPSLVDSPANPDRTALIGNTAKALASSTMAVDVRDKNWITQQGMGMFLSVGDGNAPGLPDNEPRMVEMVYTPADGQYDKTVLLVGKGIVFDTGGTNLKSSEYIHNMRGDMAGGGAVIGAMKAIDEAKLKGVRVVGLVPLTENRIGHNASLENRAVVSRSGKRVAISNTDAEGRLVLGDAIHYGLETYKPDVLADIATLTGGKVRGLGAQNAVAISGNNRDLMSSADGISKRQLGRRTAVLPLGLAHHRWVTRDAAKTDGQGSFADVYNAVDYDAAAVYGVTNPLMSESAKMLQHSAQGAAFIREHLPAEQADTPWVHYDMAGAEYGTKDAKRGNWEWATGFGVEDLYNLTKQVAEGKIKPNAAKSEVVQAFSNEDVE